MKSVTINSRDRWVMTFDIEKWFTENSDKAIVSIVIVPDQHKFITTITFVECGS